MQRQLISARKDLDTINEKLAQPDAPTQDKCSSNEKRTSPFDRWACEYQLVRDQGYRKQEIKYFEKEEKRLTKMVDYEKAWRAGPWC